MGVRVAALADAADDFEVVARTDRSRSGSSSSEIGETVDLIIDFSTDEGALSAAGFCDQHRAALLVATTGLSEQTTFRIRSCAQHSPVLIAPNTSRGVAILTWLVGETSKLLADAASVDLVESHHAGKRDQPSGTALRLAEAIRSSGADFGPERLHCIRAGGIIGRHTVQFSSQEEFLEFSHTAISRDLFAAGALEAGRWLVQQPPGLYDIAQAWGLPVLDRHRGTASDHPSGVGE
jgi:4-hydroxy-tetrahydrodipicolinate reductase